MYTIGITFCLEACVIQNIDKLTMTTLIKHTN